MTAPLLQVEGLDAGYGEIAVLHDVGFAVEQGEIAAIVGANGAGKTTLLSALAGLIALRRGRVSFAGDVISGRKAHELPDRGLALVPEGGRLFPYLTVEENLELGAYAPKARARTRERMDEVMAIFPVLSERRKQLAGRLSGGERQMCAIARALMCRPALLMLDEPSVGLSPLMSERVLDTIARLVRTERLTAIIVEQRVTEVLEIADRAHILDHGRIVLSGPAGELRDDKQIQETYMGL
jgi:branched-chain amino acid transport system ATP-binding protein